MALSFSEKFRGSIDSKAFRAFEVTADGSTVSIDASALDLDYIETVMVCGAAGLELETHAGTAIAFSSALANGDKFNIWAIGW